MANDGVIHLAKAVSRLLGWAYVFCWSLSFYPQPILNHRRKSTEGLSIDFPTLNILGFVSYSISCAAFLYSPTIRNQYAYRHPASPTPTVRFNDLAFALHAVVLCIITYSQFFPSVWNFKVGVRQRASRAALGIFWGCIFGVIVVAFIVTRRSSAGGYDPSEWAWIDVVYAISYVKLTVTVVKYVPQAWMNYKRKSTVGWSIDQILLDFAGGVMSIMQLLIDSSLQADWSGVAGNPVKFGLGNISIAFDIVFMTQHYLLYRHRRQVDEEESAGGEERPLLQGEL